MLVHNGKWDFWEGEGEVYSKVADFFSESSSNQEMYLQLPIYSDCHFYIGFHE